MNSIAATAHGYGRAEIEQRLVKLTGASNAYSAIRRLCTSVVRASNQEVPPFHIKPLLDVIGVEFKYSDVNTGQAEASVSIKDGSLFLEVPKAHFKGGSGRSKRWRFSIAHEFVHIILLRALGASLIELTFRDEETYSFIEDLCDYAASHILLPRPKLLQELRKSKISSKTISIISHKYNVSEAVIFRSINDFLPCGGVFGVKKYKRKNSEKRELRISFCSTPYRERQIRPWLPLGCTMRHINLSSGTFEGASEGGRKIEDIIISINKKVWKLHGLVVPWVFGQEQKDIFVKNRSLDVLDDEVGYVLFCSEAGKLDATLFQ
ncbi:MAG: ImmA/IrrE family metallo-endopeptidase [Nisaea sp.]|uniref:ImmA/IrrE family metallo-endopeptidase n=1 Tax=Nisaea sp. TaxID=2024842 RepID=UPI001B02788D|nr:ImmA/IrrE family metallo-endopeptidase [Nisaea sp.]MBO6561846.1 ImmA/IrrE family metallo-endopeptidase [Nisaea sp.]